MIRTESPAGTVVLTPDDYAILDEDDFGVPGLVATEVIGPFVGVQAAGPLIMVHDGVFEPHHGITHHPHRMNERLFYILEGAVDHDDAMNDIQGHMATGDLGRLTEGRRGMLHQEWNNTDGRARAFILVYSADPTPERASFDALRDDDAPRYDEADGVATKELLGSRARFPIHGDVRWFTDSRLSPGASLPFDLAPGEGGLIAPLDGAVSSDGQTIRAGETLVAPPRDEQRSIAVASDEGARVLRVVFGPGYGFVER